MPSWWDSLETMTRVGNWARAIGLGLGTLAAICGAVIFFSGRRVEALKAKRDAPRVLTSEASVLLLNALRGEGDKGHIEIVFPGADSEASAFGTTLFQVVRQSGWSVGLSPVTPPSPVSGLLLQTHNLNTPPAHAVAFGRACESAGLKLKSEARNELRSDEVYLFIGSKAKK